MGRHSWLNKRKLVSFDPKTKISKCLLCDKAMKGNLLGNIKRHYVRIHKYNFEIGAEPTAPYINEAVYKRMQKVPKEQRQQHTSQIIKPEASSSSFEITLNPSHTASTPSFQSSSSAAAYYSSSTFKLNKHEFLKCCVGLVSEANIPFRLFDDTRYFKRIIEPYENAYNLNLNAIRVEELSYTFANDVKEYIRIILDKKFISLKVEVATKHDRSIAVLNVQHIRDFRIQNVTIGFIELKKRNIGEFLKNELLKILNDYNVDVNQIYAFIIDSAGNCFNGMQQLQSELLRLHDFENADDDNVTTVEEEDNEEAEEIQIEIENFAKMDMKLKELFADVCYVAHAPKLAATDFFECFKTEIEECRKKVHYLRQQIQESNNLRKPFLDRANSWFSTYFMIESLYFLKEFVNTDEMETQIDWYFVETFLEAFKPLVDCASQLQSEQYIIGDFFRDWLLCETKLEQIIKNTCAKNLYDCMQKRKLEMMESEWFLAALYFDARFNFIGSPFFDDDKRRTAALYILNLKTRLNEWHSTDLETENECIDELSATTSAAALPATIAHDDPYGALELKLSLSTTLPADNNSKLSQKIENLSYGQRMPFSTNILDYWKTLAFQEKELAQLAQIIFAVPANQFSMGRSVRALATILANQRINLNVETLTNMNFVKLNSDIFDII